MKKLKLYYSALKVSLATTAVLVSAIGLTLYLTEVIVDGLISLLGSPLALIAGAIFILFVSIFFSALGTIKHNSLPPSKRRIRYPKQL